ncbi:Uncharacterized protein Adt_02256 [Abeliophyllum distichum]|uniref:Uncharacterized protein n=1 Tax=Abeliophyllum distichum TaxID=126358 RepID=A0ABD1VXJ6_9LAMI
MSPQLWSYSQLPKIWGGELCERRNLTQLLPQLTPEPPLPCRTHNSRLRYQPLSYRRTHHSSVAGSTRLPSSDHHDLTRCFQQAIILGWRKVDLGQQKGGNLGEKERMKWDLGEGVFWRS